ncbi:YcgN family cysteine cluster protein [Desulfoluna sp.]|uniref:YcgN family cysteine cluster protein n=1 Tax=Desulfoluna sp. TaxID=2045199 RepID=UPI00261A0606|nr:YcgN family cysteine cluster protein [Desulfoluna sp.]
MKKTANNKDRESRTSFWENTPLDRMTQKQWESLCDGCGLCCMEKLEDAETGAIYVTSVACQYLDLESSRCRIYENRTFINDVCVQLTPADVAKYRWLPETCAYRRVLEGRPLPDWHPLLCGSAKQMKKAGATACDRAVSGDAIHPDDLHHFIDYEV